MLLVAIGTDKERFEFPVLHLYPRIFLQKCLLVVFQILALLLQTQPCLLQEGDLLDQMVSDDLLPLGLVELTRCMLTLTRLVLLRLRDSK